MPVACIHDFHLHSGHKAEIDDGAFIVGLVESPDER